MVMFKTAFSRFRDRKTTVFSEIGQPVVHGVMVYPNSSVAKS
jgi:hypothetical protein